MSLEFNRRSFLKYTAVAAVAVAGSSLLAGCDSSSYQKTGTIGSKLTLMGEHTLLDGDNAPKYVVTTAGDTPKGTITCKLTHKCTTEKVPLCVDEGCYELTVYNSSDKKSAYVDYTTSSMTLNPKKYDLKDENGEQTFTLTIKDVALKEGQYVDLKYWPRKVASTGDTSYTRVYCTWQMQYAKDATGTMKLVKR